MVLREVNLLAMSGRGEPAGKATVIGIGPEAPDSN